MIVTITEPAALAVTVKEAKDHLRIIDGHYDDVYIHGLLVSAIKTIEARSGFRLYTQTVEMLLDQFPRTRSISLGVGKVTSVTSVKYDDGDDTEQTWASSNYWTELSGRPARIAYKSTAWPSTKTGKPGAVRIRFEAGWDDRHDIPDHFKVAVKLLVGHWYKHREQVIVGAVANELPEGVDHIIRGNQEYFFYEL